MSELEKIFSPACKGELIVINEGHGLADIHDKHGRIELEYKIEIKLVGAKIDLPKYLNDHLTGYEFSAGHDHQYYLSLAFKPGKDNKFVRSIRKALCEELEQQFPKTFLQLNPTGGVTLGDTLPAFNAILDYLAKPVTQNNVLTRANTIYNEKQLPPALRPPEHS